MQGLQGLILSSVVWLTQLGFVVVLLLEPTPSIFRTKLNILELRQIKLVCGSVIGIYRFNFVFYLILLMVTLKNIK